MLNEIHFYAKVMAWAVGEGCLRLNGTANSAQ